MDLLRKICVAHMFVNG